MGQSSNVQPKSPPSTTVPSPRSSRPRLTPSRLLTPSPLPQDLHCSRRQRQVDFFFCFHLRVLVWPFFGPSKISTSVKDVGNVMTLPSLLMFSCNERVAESTEWRANSGGVRRCSSSRRCLFWVVVNSEEATGRDDKDFEVYMFLTVTIYAKLMLNHLNIYRLLIV